MVPRGSFLIEIFLHENQPDHRIILAHSLHFFLALGDPHAIGQGPLVIVRWELQSGHHVKAVHQPWTMMIVLHGKL